MPTDPPATDPWKRLRERVCHYSTYLWDDIEAALAAERQQATAQQDAAEEEIRQLTLARDEADALIARYGFGKAEAEVASLTQQRDEIEAALRDVCPLEPDEPDHAAYVCYDENGEPVIEAETPAQAIRELTDCWDGLHQKCQALAAQVAAQDAEIARLKDMADSLSYQPTTEEFANNRAEIALLSVQLTEARAHLEQVTAERDHHIHTIHVLESDLAQLRCELLADRERIKAQRAALLTLRGEQVRDLAKELGKLQATTADGRMLVHQALVDAIRHDYYGIRQLAAKAFEATS